MPQDADDSEVTHVLNGRAQHFFERCGALRAGKGVTKKKLAMDSDIDRSTLDKIEAAKQPVTEERVMRVFNCLNETYYGGKLKVTEHVTTTSHRQ